MVIKAHPFGLCKDVLKVTSTTDFNEAIEKILKGFLPNYSDFNDVINNHLFELNSYSNDVKLLIEYLVYDY